jgi:Domain of unknown function (DUF4136)
MAMRKLLILTLSIALLAACSGIDTQIDAQPGFALADYRQYAWATPPLRDSRDAELLQIDRSVRAAVDDELQRLGCTQVERSTAAALVDYRLGSRMDISYPGSNSPRDDAARMWDLDRNSATNTAVYNHPTLPYIERVELRLSIQAQRSGVIVWQGSALKDVDDANPGQRFSAADIRRAVQLLMGQLKTTAPH